MKTCLITLLCLSLLSCNISVNPNLEVKNKRYFVLDAGAYNINIDVLISKDISYVVSTLKENYGIETSEKEYENISAYTFSYEGNCVVWLRKASLEQEDIATVSHEMFHVTAYLMRYSGVELVPESEEAFAYQLDYLVEQVFKNIKNEN